MEIKTYTVADLKKALETEEFWLAQTLPITKHKALSFSQNPRAEAQDPVLLVAYRENRVIGYLGILPDCIYVKDVALKMGWLTSWWVDSAFGSSGVGAILLFKALNAYSQYIGVSGSSKAARKAMHASQKFTSLKPMPELEIQLGFNVARDIPNKLSALIKFKTVFRLIEVVLDEIVNIRAQSWQRHNPHGKQLMFEYISAVDEETDRFIQHHNKKDLTRKTRSDFNWIMNNPWILSAPLKDSVSKRYYFSSRAGRFSYLGVKVYGLRGEMIGFILFKIRDDRMSLVYSYFERRYAADVAAAAIQQAIAMNASVLSLYDRQLIKAFSKLGFPSRSVIKTRSFSLSKGLADIAATDYNLQGGDGDLAFY